MKIKKKQRSRYSEHSYWQSYSDMMAALLLIFILIITITLAIYKQKTIALDISEQELAVTAQALEEYRVEIEKSNQELADSLAKLQEAYAFAAMTQEELVAAQAEIQNANEELAWTKSQLEDIVGIRTDIIGELQTKFNNSSMQVDSQTGSITFSSDVLFRYGSATLTNDSKATLREIIPLYLGVLLQDNYRDYIAEIIIEGHTDTSGGYFSNMELSTQRATSVAQFCLNSNNGLDENMVDRLQVLLTVNGRSFSNPIYKLNSTEIDMDASRRVEIKFRLKEDEMIEKIAEILAQGVNQ